MAEPINIGLDFGSLGLRAAYIAKEQMVSVVANAGWQDPSQWLLSERVPTTVPGVYFPSLKSRLGILSTAYDVASKRAIETVSKALAELHRLVEEQAGRPAGQLVVTVPALYSATHRVALRDLALTAGFGDVHLLNDSMAAVIGHAHQREEPLTALVYSVGYSGFEVGLIRVAKERYWAIAYDGTPILGGEAFDQLIIRDCIQLLTKCRLWLPGYDLVSDGWLKLRNFAERLKEMLSTSEQAELNLGITNSIAQVLQFTLSRKQFEQAITGYVLASLDAAERLLDAANLSIADIDEVLLLGGSTRIGLIQRLVAERFARQPIITSENLFLYGAAIYAANLGALPTTEAALIRSEESQETAHPITTMPLLAVSLPSENSTEQGLKQMEKSASMEPLLKPDITLSVDANLASAIDSQPAISKISGRELMADADKPLIQMETVLADRERLFRYARQLIDQRAYDRGRGFLEGLIQDAQTLLAAIPSRPALMIKREVEQILRHSYELLQENRFQQAVEVAHYAYSVDPENPQIFQQVIDIHCQAAMANTTVEKYQKSIGWLMCAHSHDRTNTKIHDLIAERHFIHAQQMAERDNYAEALKALAESQYFNPEHEGAKALSTSLTQQR
ncbi:MAG: Hsp70 family protein [Acidobacteriota bacterium]